MNDILDGGTGNGDGTLDAVAMKPKRDYVADHARRTLRKAGLTKEQAKNVVAAMQSESAKTWRVGSSNGAMCGEATYRVDVSRFSRSIPGGIRLSQVVGDSFQWDTAEHELGLKYGYFTNLHDITINMERTSA